MRIFPVTLVGALAASGCATSEYSDIRLQDGFESDLTEMDSCGDLFAFAHDADDRVGMSIDVADNLVDEAAATGAWITREYDLAEDGVSIQVDMGEGVSGAWCTDEARSDRRVEATYLATAGELIVTVIPSGDTGDGGTLTATLTMSEVTLVNAVDDGDVVDMSGFEMVNVDVGWLP